MRYLLSKIGLLRSTKAVSVRSFHATMRRLGGGNPKETPSLLFYRRLPQIEDYPRHHRIMGTVMLSFMWWWIMWHFYKTPEKFFGHFPYPDPSVWTDEELGIPPDDTD